MKPKGSEQLRVFEFPKPNPRVGAGRSGSLLKYSADVPLKSGAGGYKEALCQGAPVTEALTRRDVLPLLEAPRPVAVADVLPGFLRGGDLLGEAALDPGVE